MLPTDTKNTVAQTLKHQTEENHLALESLLIPKLNSIASANDYVALLKAFYGYFHPVEQLILTHVHASELPDILQRRKAEFLIKDIHALNGNENHLPIAEKLPGITNVYEAFGAMYVLEGSTLGGRGIVKMLLKNGAANITEEQLTFFSGYGAATGSMWLAFLQKLNDLVQDDNEMLMMVKAANDTFYFFKQWLQKQLINE